MITAGLKTTYTNLIYLWNLKKKSQTQKQKGEQWLPGAGGEGKGEILFTEYRVLAQDDGKVLLQMGGGDGCTMRMYLI